jgi:hypothetical protein
LGFPFLPFLSIYKNDNFFVVISLKSKKILGKTYNFAILPIYIVSESDKKDVQRQAALSYLQYLSSSND